MDGGRQLGVVNPSFGDYELVLAYDAVVVEQAHLERAGSCIQDEYAQRF
jgi:hypothetical protein